MADFVQKISCVLILISVLLPVQTAAYSTIAHRGLFHDVNDFVCRAENSADALTRALDFGLPGVEFDVRMTSDGVVMVTHDVIGNRATIADNDGGNLNPIDVALNLQPKRSPNYINSHGFAYWNHVPLKVYGRNGQIVKTDGYEKMESLDAMIGHLQGLQTPSFFLILDIQDPSVFNEAAKIVNLRGAQSQVYLKFFATKAIDSTKYKYAGPQTCRQYAIDHGLSGLQVIPQINDGELTFSGNTARIKVFQTQLSVTEYLDCWAKAQQTYGDAAKVMMVSASVPANNAVAYNAAGDALTWGKRNARKTISILTNPDAGRRINNKCVLWTWQSNNVGAATFNGAARSAKDFFISNLNPDYVIVDLMGDVQTHTWSSDFNFVSSNLC